MVNILNFFKINKDNISAKSNHHESIENVSLQKTFLYSDKLNDTTLSLKTRNSLLRCNILTVGDLARIGLKNLLREKNIGQKTLEEIEATGKTLEQFYLEVIGNNEEYTGGN